MITAIDTSILLDVFKLDAAHFEDSRKRLTQAYDGGGLVVSEIVYAELVPQFSSRRVLDETLARLSIDVVTGSRDIAFVAGERFARYRKAGGPRTRILADFLIGAHALHHAERFLTRDRGFYRTYFPEAKMV